MQSSPGFCWALQCRPPSLPLILYGVVAEISIDDLFKAGVLPGLLMLVLLGGWTGITFTVRGEFFRERSRDYVQAARAIGHERNGTRRITNIVLMGMGEPLANFTPVAMAGARPWIVWKPKVFM